MFVKAQYCRNAGLGNKLFPWARAIVISGIYNYDFLDPVWFSPRGASIIRGGIDYKKALNKIWLFNNFINREHDISFLRSLMISSTQFQLFDRLEEPVFNIASKNKINICFRWNACHEFSDLMEFRGLILDNLKKITRKKSISFYERYEGKKFIGLNIRTGKDFVRLNSSKQGYFLTEIDWFVRALKIIRNMEGNLPAIIVSDGGEKELRAILTEPDTFLLNSSNAIEDLLVLAESKILLGSGNSTFSAWASFLGGMDTYSSGETQFSHFNISDTRSTQIIGIL